MMRRFFAGLLTVLVMFGVMAAVAPAAHAAGTETYGRLDVSRTVDLSVHYHQGSIDFNDVQFRVYRVADMSDTAQFTLRDRFAACPAAFGTSMTAADWVNTAATMSAWISQQGIQADYTCYTDRYGNFELTGLPVGLYLVTGGSHQRQYRDTGNAQETLRRLYYQTAPFLVAAPSLEDGDWNYDVSISPKFTVSEEATVSKRVLKVWDDKGYEYMRPDSVSFDLLRDGRVYDTVVLSDGNLWRYQWDDLDNTHDWQIAERTPANYQTRTRTEGLTLVVSNEYLVPGTNTVYVKPDTPEPDVIIIQQPGETIYVTPPTTDIPDTDVPTGQPTTGTTTTPSGTTPTDTPKDDTTYIDIPEGDLPLAKLPQTGQLWWPVPILAGCGIMLFLFGWIRRRRAD